MLEAILNWPEEMMALDYELTSLSKWGPRRRTSEGWQKSWEERKGYDPENNSLQIGSWNYLRSIGVTDDELNAIREILLEPARQ